MCSFWCFSKNSESSTGHLMYDIVFERKHTKKVQRKRCAFLSNKKNFINVEKMTNVQKLSTLAALLPPSIVTIVPSFSIQTKLSVLYSITTMLPPPPLVIQPPPILRIPPPPQLYKPFQKPRKTVHKRKDSKKGYYFGAMDVYGSMKSNRLHSTNVLNYL